MMTGIDRSQYIVLVYKNNVLEASSIFTQTLDIL